MPEMTCTVRWPDGREEGLYSPSLVMHDHLTTGGEYAVAEFVTRTDAALDEASERVRAKYGFACTSAEAQKTEIHARAASFSGGGVVRVLAMEPPLPSTAAQVTS